MKVLHLCSGLRGHRHRSCQSIPLAELESVLILSTIEYFHPDPDQW